MTKYGSIIYNSTINGIQIILNTSYKSHFDYINDIILDSKLSESYPKFDPDKLSNCLTKILTKYSSDLKPAIHIHCNDIESKQLNDLLVYDSMDPRIIDICIFAFDQNATNNSVQNATNNSVQNAINYGNMIRIINDLSELEFDIINHSVSNYVLSIGAQKSFNIYTENKIKFIEKCLEQKIYSNTVKDLVKLLDHNFDYFFCQTSIDLKSEI
jgi:hypothetical protein